MIIVPWSIYRKYQRTEATDFGKVLENKWYVDEFYDKIIVQPLHKFGGFLKSVIENAVVDGLVNGVGKAVNYGSRQLRLLQSAQVGSYVLLTVLSMLLVFVVPFFLRK